MSLSTEYLYRKNCLIIAVFLVLMGGCMTTKSSDSMIPEKTVYLKVNIHYQYNGDDNKASYANYTNPGQGHKILHVNTPVKIEEWTRNGFKIINTDNDEVIFFEYHRGRMDMSQEDYLKIITSPEKVSLAKLSAVDRKGVEEGKASKGMTKDGVMMALGYPATHRTPSTESNTWTYWTNRFSTMDVMFDNKGIVEEIKS